MEDETQLALKERLKSLVGTSAERARQLKTILRETLGNISEAEFAETLQIHGWSMRPVAERRALVARAIGAQLAARVDFGLPAEEFDGELCLTDPGGVWETSNPWLRGASEPVLLRAPRLKTTLSLRRGVEKDGQWTMTPTTTDIAKRVGRVSVSGDNPIRVMVQGDVLRKDDVAKKG
jgi:hypothetical protein